MSNDLNLPTIADGQADQQWQSSNDGDAAIAAALSEVGTAIDFSGGNVTLSAAQFRAQMVFRPTGLSTTRTLTLPAVRRPFIFHNNDSADTVTLKSTDGASPETALTIAVAAGQMFIGYTNGSSPGLYGGVLTVGAASSGEPYDVPAAFSDVPDAGEVFHKVIIVRDVEFEANFSGSVGHVGTNPDATFAIDVKDDGSSIGTISISTGGAFTFTTSGGTAKTVAAGSRLEFVAPANSPAEATIADMAATLKGTA